METQGQQLERYNISHKREVKDASKIKYFKYQSRTKILKLKPSF